jgi:uncharacterized protein (DUF2249 family)
MPIGASGEPVLDARVLPPSSRHAIIMETFDRLSADESLVLINDHDPRPLQRALGLRYGDNFSVEYLDAGPELWRVRYRKAASDNCCGGHCGG